MIWDLTEYFDTPNSSKLALCHLSITVGYIWRFAAGGDYISVWNAFMMWRLVVRGRWVLVGWDMVDLPSVLSCQVSDCVLLPSYIGTYMEILPPHTKALTHINTAGTRIVPAWLSLSWLAVFTIIYIRSISLATMAIYVASQGQLHITSWP